MKHLSFYVFLILLSVLLASCLMNFNTTYSKINSECKSMISAKNKSNKEEICSCISKSLAKDFDSRLDRKFISEMSSLDIRIQASVSILKNGIVKKEIAKCAAEEYGFTGNDVDNILTLIEFIDF